MLSSVLHSGQNTLGFGETSCLGGAGWAAGLAPAAGPGPGPGGPGCFCGGFGEEGCWAGGVVCTGSTDIKLLAWFKSEAPKPKSFPKGCSGGGGWRDGELPALRVWSCRGG